MAHIFEVLGQDSLPHHAYMVSMEGSVIYRLLEYAVREYDLINRNPLRDFVQVSGKLPTCLYLTQKILR